jgi:hypothetical protein
MINVVTIKITNYALLCYDHGFDIDVIPIVSTSYKNVLNARYYQQA